MMRMWNKKIKGIEACCERCGDMLNPKDITWLEHSSTDGLYHIKIPEGHISQGYFSFGKACAKIILKKTKNSNRL
jgi:hypothetical protein